MFQFLRDLSQEDILRMKSTILQNMITEGKIPAGTNITLDDINISNIRQSIIPDPQPMVEHNKRVLETQPNVIGLRSNIETKCPEPRFEMPVLSRPLAQASACPFKRPATCSASECGASPFQTCTQEETVKASCATETTSAETNSTETGCCVGDICSIRPSEETVKASCATETTSTETGCAVNVCTSTETCKASCASEQSQTCDVSTSETKSEVAQVENLLSNLSCDSTVCQSECSKPECTETKCETEDCKKKLT